MLINSSFREQNIFKPLGLTTTWRLTAELKERLVELAFRKFDGSGIENLGDRIKLTPRYPKEGTRGFTGP